MVVIQRKKSKPTNDLFYFLNIAPESIWGGGRRFFAFGDFLKKFFIMK